MEYQKQINKVAQILAIENPTLLRRHQLLLDAARNKVDASYAFKKGKSRSKRNTSTPQPMSKRRKISSDVRLEGLKFIDDEIK